MSSRTKWILIIIAVLVLVLLVVALVFRTSQKAVTGPGQPPLPADEKQEKKGPAIGRFEVGEITAPSRDDELHYIKVEVHLGYIGDLEKELTARKAEIRDAISIILTKTTVQRAKDDYADKFLHKDIEKAINELLGTTTQDARIVQVWIPAFLIN